MITNDEKQIILKLSSEGYGVSQIAQAFGIDHTTILYHLKNPNKPVQLRRFERKEKFRGYKKIVGPPLWNKPQYKIDHRGGARTRKNLKENEPKKYEELLKEYREKVFVRDRIGNLIKVGDKKKLEKRLKNCG